MGMWAVESREGPPLALACYLNRSSGERAIGSSNRDGGSWGYPIIPQPRTPGGHHRACAWVMTFGGRVVDGCRLSTGFPLLPPVRHVLSSRCPKRIHRDIHSLCVPIVTGDADTWPLTPTAPAA